MPCSVLSIALLQFVYPACHICLSKENTSSELWTLVQSLPLIHLPLLLFTFCQATISFHTIQLILCYSKPVRLITSLFAGTKSSVCVVQVSKLLATPLSC